MRSLVIAIFFATVVLSEQTQYQSCGKGEECADGECCMLTGNRYGEPSCQPLREQGDVCRPNSQPQNYTLSTSPYSEPSLYTGVYWAVCPCQSSLKCNNGICA